MNTKKNQTLKKSISTKLLVKRALKNKPVWKASPGFKYLKDIEIGRLFKTGIGFKGILANKSLGSASVFVLEAKHIDTNDREFYLGKRNWSLKTEVKVIG